MFKKRNKRFIIKEEHSLGLWSSMYIVSDISTGVNYVMTVIIFSVALTPLLDSKGNVVIDEYTNPYQVT